MPRQPAARVCRTVGLQAQSQPEGVWIGEKAVGRAYERYWRVSLAARRMASNVPGPMENRRRLGKRQMTELGVQVHPPMPPWALSMAPDLTKWRWKPPTQRLSAAQGQIPSEHIGNLLVGLPTLLDNRLGSWLDSRRGGKIGSPSYGVEVERISTVKPVTAPFFAELDALAVVPEDAPDAVAIRLEALAGQLQQLLALGAFNREEVGGVCESLLATLRGKLGTSYATLAEDYSLRLCAALLEGITSCKILPRDYYGETFWAGLLSRMTELPASDRLGEVFDQFMEAVPATYLREMVPALVPLVINLVGHLSLDLSGNDATSDVSTTTEIAETERLDLVDSDMGNPSASERARSLARALDQLDRVQQQRFRREVTKTLLSRSTSDPETQRRQVRSWLSVLARMAHVEQAYLFGTLKEHQALCRGQHIPATELCNLLAIQWGSRGYADSSATMDACRSICRGDEETALASLALCVYQRHNKAERPGLQYSLWRCARKLGLEAELVASLMALSRRRTLPPAFFEHLAWTSDDLRVSAAIQSLYNREVRRNNPSLPMWNPRVWNRRAAVAGQALDVSLTATEVFEMLDLWEYSGQIMAKGRNDRRRWCKVGPQTEALVVKLAVRFAYASDLNSREALRRISHCLRFLQDHGCSIPPAVARGLFRILTQGFASNQLGSPVRFQWFVDIVKKQLGEAAALDCARALDRGREGVRHRQQATKQRLV